MKKYPVDHVLELTAVQYQRSILGGEKNVDSRKYE